MTDLAATFQQEAVAEAYRHRPPYPNEVFDRLLELIVDVPRRVLDVGAGEGAIARPLAPRVEWIDAIDFSAPMVAAGKQRPGGDHPNLAWQVSPIETASLDGPYALVTAGASIHWMPWEETFARIVPHLTPNAQSSSSGAARSIRRGWTRSSPSSNGTRARRTSTRPTTS